MPADTPLAWRPNPTPLAILGGRVNPGDWVRVEITYKGPGIVPLVPGYFLIHVLYRPDEDAGQARPEQPTMYGPPPDGERPVYRINTNVGFQPPARGQVFVVAANEAPADAIVYVTLHRYARRTRPIFDLTEDPAVMMALGSLYPGGIPIDSPPIVGRPALVPATYLQIPDNLLVTDMFPFPSGAVAVETPAGVTLEIRAMGNTFRFDTSNGKPVELGALACGTWRPNPTVGTVSSLTIWSSLC